MGHRVGGIPAVLRRVGRDRDDGVRATRRADDAERRVSGRPERGGAVRAEDVAEQVHVDDAGRRKRHGREPERPRVITSYSIHYTKLYEGVEIMNKIAAAENQHPLGAEPRESFCQRIVKQGGLALIDAQLHDGDIGLGKDVGLV